MRIFLSHSSRDNEAAERLRDWLVKRGDKHLFLDFDKHLGIPPGADWERKLYREIAACHAVIIVATVNWHESKWCWSEFTQARALGKPIFPVVEAPSANVYVSPDLQQVDLTRDRDDGLAQLARALSAIARNQHDFTWDESRPPYPGLLAFQEEDAAIYFGRDEEIRGFIERLNARRIHGGLPMRALLGGSGSGKSSLLRAGVLPQLRRDKLNWIVLPPFRPQLHPLDEFARALVLASEQQNWRQCRGWLDNSSVATLLSDFGQDLRMRARAPEARILISIDQAEELFGASSPSEAARFPYEWSCFEVPLHSKRLVKRRNRRS